MEISFDRACALVEAALSGSAREEFVNDVSREATLGAALERVRDSMSANTFKTGGHQVHLDKMLRSYDGRTRAEGFHILHDWDGVSQQVNPDIIPVDVLNFMIRQRGGDASDAVVPAILLDYYYMHVLALLSMRVWDDGNPNANFDRVDALLRLLQGPGGSGQLFADDAATLMLIGTSHYELKEWGYGTLLDRVKTLSDAHQAKIAICHASSMGCHLRFGFEAQCGRDTVALRDDNVADYPWLCFALSRVIREYARVEFDGVTGRERDVVVEALLNGLSPDARAFVGAAPASLSKSGDDREAFLEMWERHKASLLKEFEQHRPSDTGYSPLALFFNFAHNVVKGAVVDSLMWGQTWDLTFNDLLTGTPRDGVDATDLVTLANTVMSYARTNPDRIRGKLMPVIVYDPAGGRQAYTTAIKKLTE
ncbi:MAG: hypothetical protein ABI665_09780 [Vicinamibacterales bacterium]